MANINRPPVTMSGYPNIDYKTSLKISTLEFTAYIEVISFTSNSVQPHAIQPFHGDR